MQSFNKSKTLDSAGHLVKTKYLKGIELYENKIFLKVAFIDLF